MKTYIKNKGNSCSEIVRKNFVENSVNKVGTSNFMEIEGFQQKLLANRKISRVVNFKGKEFTVVGSYEERFLKVLSPLVMAANDVEAPGIEIKWKDESGRERLHITDFLLFYIIFVIFWIFDISFSIFYIFFHFFKVLIEIIYLLYTI